jgi:hypothetical protein
MDRGQKLQLLRRTAATLTSDGWSSDIDLTLRTFGFPTYDEWNGGDGPYGYVLEMLQRGTDEDLAALNGHLHPDDVASAVHDDGAAVWGGPGFRLFMSHTTPHKVQITQMAAAFETWGMRAFVAHKDIVPTTAWQSAITTALNTCDALCALLTDDFAASAWCDQEVGFAVGRSKVIVPLKVNKDPHGFIGAVQALPVSLSPFSTWGAAGDVLKALAANDVTKLAMTEPVIKSFGTSGSFDTTRARYLAVCALAAEEWTPERVTYVRRQLAENSQLANANLIGGRSVPDALEAHCEKSESSMTSRSDPRCGPAISPPGLLVGCNAEPRRRSLGRVVRRTPRTYMDE